MGCTTSHAAFISAAAAAKAQSSSRPRQVDPAALCRERVALIRAAADRRFALAAAHAAYFRELAAVGAALRRFAASALSPAPPSHASSPVLTLPPSPTKTGVAATASLPPSPSSSSTVSPLSHSLSDEHLEAPPDAKRVGGSEKAPSKAASSPRHHYMRNSSTVPTVVYEDPNAHRTEGESSYRYGYGYEYAYPYPYGPDGEVVTDVNSETVEMPRQPPPPPAAEVSPWEFFDPFVSYEQFMDDYSLKNNEIDGKLPTYGPSDAELRRMEGIPELEDEAEAEALKPSTLGNAEQNVKGKEPIQGTAGRQGEADRGMAQRKNSEPVISGLVGEAEKGVTRNDSVPTNASSKDKKESKSAASLKDNDGVDGCSSHGKKKAVAFDEDGSIAVTEGDGGSHGKSLLSAVSSESFSPLHHGKRDVVEAMDDVKERFDEALNHGAEVSRLLEVGKVPHQTTPRVLRYFSSRVVDPLALHVPSSSCLPKSQSRTPRSLSSKASSSASSVGGGRNDTGNLSSTLEKLYVWEKKLYQEVKDEEKLRILYERKYMMLKSLDERGAESNMIDPTRLSVRKLRSKISISIKAVNSISTRIHKIRDEELHPQLVDLIQGLRRMWKAVLQCHKKQLLAIKDSKIHLLKANTISQSSVSARATIELERELTKWYRCFNKLISSQRSYVEALNGWLKKWLPDEQEEETPDGIPPFSPGRLGAPPAFVISNDWFQAIETVSNSEVLKAMDHFAKLVHEFRKRQEDEHRQKLKADHASRVYNRRHEVLQREFGLSSNLDIIASGENSHHNHDDRVIELERMRKRRDEERIRHEEVVKHTHLAASATLPVGLIPTLQQVVSFFQGNLLVYMGIRI